MLDLPVPLRAALLVLLAEDEKDRDGRDAGDLLGRDLGDEIVGDHVGVLEAVGPGLDRPAEEVVLGLELAGVDGDEPLLGVGFFHGGQDLFAKGGVLGFEV